MKAHAHLDALVDKAYGLKPTATDSDRVALLFNLYAAAEREARAAKRGLWAADNPINPYKWRKSKR